MSRRRRSANMLPVILAVICMGLAWSIYQQTRAPGNTPGDEVPPPANDAGVKPLPPVANFSMPPIETYSEIIERPMFSMTRRPPKEDVAESIEEPLDFSLVGIIISAGEPRALVNPGSARTLLRLGVGDEVGGWKVVEIGPYAATFRRGGEQRELRLSYEAPPRSAATPTRQKAKKPDEENNRDAENAESAETSSED